MAPRFGLAGYLSASDIGAARNASGGLDKEEWNALIGIVTAIVGNVLISFALNLQRYAHLRLERQNNGQSSRQKQNSGTNDRRQDDGSNAGRDGSDAPDERIPFLSTSNRKDNQAEEKGDEQEESGSKNYLKSPYWWGGILLMITGEAGNFLAYGFAPASIVSPLGVVAMISNCIIAPVFLKERFRKRDGLGVLIAIGGAVTVVLSAKGSEKRLGPHGLWSAITRWEFELYLGITALLMLVLAWASRKYGDRTVFIDLGLVGLFGGYTALATKGIASLLSDTLWRTLTFPVTYLLIAILVITALLQVRYVNKALQRFNSTQVIPTQFVLFTISVVVGSAVLYREFESATGDRVGKFIGGILLTFLGVYLITSGRKSENSSDEENDEDDGDDGEDSSTTAIQLHEEDSGPKTLRQHSVASQASETYFQHRPATSSSLEVPQITLDQEGRDELIPLSQATTRSLRGNSVASVDNHFLTPTPGPSSRRASAFDRTPSSTLRPAPRPRRSFADMIGGPISSPLSSSLSGIVAIAKRKELERARIRLSTRRSTLDGLTVDRDEHDDRGGNV